MSNLTRRGASANNPAKLPSLQAARAADPNVQRALEALREWVEVRLGARGDRFERAVTFRDLEQELAGLEARLGTPSTGTDLSGLSALSSSIEAVRAALQALSDTVSREDQQLRTLYEGLRALIEGAFRTDTSTSVDGEVVLFSSTTGKLGKRATGTGFAKLAAGVLSAQSAADARTELQGDGSAVDQVGFRGIPLTSRSADYTLVLADAGKGTLHPESDANARTFTIPANASVAFPVGAAHTFVNETAEVVTIAITSDTLVLGGTTTTGSRSLAQNGIATALKVAATKWIISGAGLT